MMTSAQESDNPDLFHASLCSGHFVFERLVPKSKKPTRQNFMISMKPQKFDISRACMMEIRAAEVGGSARDRGTLEGGVMEGDVGQEVLWQV